MQGTILSEIFGTATFTIHDSDLTVKGSFLPITVTLDAQGGSGGDETVTATCGKAMPEATMPTKENCDFLGYFDAQTGGTQYYNADGTSARAWDKDSPTTLYAQWRLRASTVTLDLAGGSGTTSTTFIYGQIPEKIAVPTKDGAKFLGFFTEPGGKGKMVFDEYGLASEKWMTDDAEVTLHACWINELWVSVPAALSFDIREVKSAQVFRPETLASSPVGWEADAETAAILDVIGGGQPVTVVGPVTANATVWTPRSVGLHTLTHDVGDGVETAKFNVTGFTYTVAFDANGGMGEMETQTFEYGLEGTAPENGFTRVDYAFVGWNTRKDGKGTEIAAGGKFTNLVTSPDETGCLYAMWEVSMETAYEVGVMEDGEPAPRPIKVPAAWIGENLPDADPSAPDKVADELEKTDPATGLKKWQEFVLDVKPGDTSAKVWIDSPQQKEKDKIKVQMREFSPTRGAGFTVKYRLDTELNGQAKTQGALVNSPDFDIDVTQGDPTGLYTVNVVFVPDGAEDSDEVVRSVNTMGILKVLSQKTLEIVAVPWNRLAPEDENQPVRVADLVKTATLTAGDKLHVYDKESKNYKSWRYDISEGWVALGTYKVSAAGLEQALAPDQAEQTVARGSAVWLERQDASKPFYLYGQYAKDEVETKIEKDKHNLVACPKMTAFRLNDAGRFGDAIGASDQIIVPQGGDKPPKTYTYRPGKGWGYSKYVGTRFTFDTTDDEVPAGTGFWYISKGGSPTIRW